MPHDKDGRPLEVGDPVHIPARITAIAPGEEYCNVTLQTEEAMHPGPNKSTLALNARQVIKAVVFPPAAVLLAALMLGLVGVRSHAQEQGTEQGTGQGVAPSIGPLTTIEAGHGQVRAVPQQGARRVAWPAAACPTCVRVERPTVQRYERAAIKRVRAVRSGPLRTIGQAVRRWFSRRL